MFFFLCTLFVFAYIRIRYPFWSVQPIFHTYDFWRYFCRTPRVIRKYPMTTKYTDPVHTTTTLFLDISGNHVQEIVNLMQCHTFSSEQIIFLINQETFCASMQDSETYLTTYHTHDFELVSTDSSHPKGVQMIQCPRLIGSVTSRPIEIYFTLGKVTIASDVVKEKGYILEHLCVHRDQMSKNLGHSLIQNHLYHQMFRTPDISWTLFKKEDGECDGVVPLVSYTMYTFCLYAVKSPNLDHGFVCMRIYNQNVEILSDFLFSLSRSSHHDEYGFTATSTLDTIQRLIQQNIYFVYALKYKKGLFAIYFFKDTQIQYEEIDGEGRTLECMAAFTNYPSSSEWDGVFFAGFLSAMYDIQTSTKSMFHALRIHNLGHCDKILDHWMWKYKPLFHVPCSYYLYNGVFPNMPLRAKHCLILL